MKCVLILRILVKRQFTKLQLSETLISASILSQLHQIGPLESLSPLTAMTVVVYVRALPWALQPNS